VTYVYPNCLTVVRWEGGRIHLNPGQQWDSNDPFVLARPEFFDDDPTAPSTTVSGREPVERGTQAPGEKRTPPRRPASSKAAKPAPTEETK